MQIRKLEKNQNWQAVAEIPRTLCLGQNHSNADEWRHARHPNCSEGRRYLVEGFCHLQSLPRGQAMIRTINKATQAARQEMYISELGLALWRAGK